ncbi:hypothetical protein [Herbidospora galbida]|nr:hypothetical protein [Herbidospora galbida]
MLIHRNFWPRHGCLRRTSHEVDDELGQLDAASYRPRRLAGSGTGERPA